MKNIYLVLILTYFTALPLWADGPGSTSGGHRCRQFISGILAQTKEAFESKEFHFLNESQYQKISEKLSQIRMSHKSFNLKDKGREMEADLKNYVIRWDNDFCSKENKDYSPVSTFILLTHEVLNFFFQKAEVNYEITGKNYGDIWNVGSQRVLHKTLGYSIEEYLIIKKIKQLLKNPKNRFYKSIKAQYDSIYDPITDFEEILVDPEINLVQVAGAEDGSEGTEWKSPKLCAKLNPYDPEVKKKNPQCQTKEVWYDTTINDYIVTLSVGEGDHERSPGHTYEKSIGVFLFRYLLIETTDLNDESPDLSSNSPKREEKVQLIKELEIPFVPID